MHMQCMYHRSASALLRICWSFDKNGDGFIDKSELQSVFEEVGKYVTEEVRCYFVDVLAQNFDLLALRTFYAL